MNKYDIPLDIRLQVYREFIDEILLINGIEKKYPIDGAMFVLATDIFWHAEKRCYELMQKKEAANELAP